MLFDSLFCLLLVLSAYGLFKLYKSPTSKNWVVKLVKFVVGAHAAGMWIWLLLLIILPKGSKLEEGIRLPRHLWMLDNITMEDGVNKQKISYGEHPRQHYIYYPAPKDSPNAHKVVFYIHGGGWCLGGPHQHVYLAKILQEQGYSLIFTAYRLCPDFGYKELQDDINSALIHSLDFLKKQQINNPQIILGGTSAGANLAALLGYDEDRWTKIGIDRGILKGVFSIVGVLDLDKMEHTSTLLSYTGPANEERYKLANPITWINAKDQFPFLCLHGKCDGLAAYENVASFCEKLKAVAPNAVDFRTFETATHLDLGASWYYDPNANMGQDTVLINWLNKL